MTDASTYEAARGLPGRVHIAPDVEALVEKAGNDLMARCAVAVEAHGAFHLALSGGSTPKALFRLLVTDPDYRGFLWEKTHIWLVDERVVPPDDDRSNYHMMRHWLLNHITTPAEQVHPMPVMESDGDRQYEQAVREALPAESEMPRLDYVLLGMGGDGHTASLFPHTPALGERERLVVFNDGETVAEPRPRMTMTYPLINAARTIAVMVTGESKRAMLQRVALAAAAAGSGIDRDLPIVNVEPTYDNAELVWYLDEPAVTAAR